MTLLDYKLLLVKLNDYLIKLDGFEETGFTVEEIEVLMDLLEASIMDFELDHST